MDLLGGYGSDASGDEAEELGLRPVSPQRSSIVKFSTLLKPKLSEAPTSSAAQPSGADADIPAPVDTHLWSKLPPPKTAGRRVVQFQTSINRDFLKAVAEDTEPDERPAKKAKKTPLTSSLKDFLPPPKNTSLPRSGAGSSSALGGGAAAGGSRSMLLPSGFFEGGGTEDEPGTSGAGAAAAADVGFSNEMFRATAGPAAAGAALPVHPSAAYAATPGTALEYEHGPNGNSYQQPHDATVYGYGSASAEAMVSPGSHADAALDPGEALLQEALRQEAEKATRRGARAVSSAQDIAFKEITADRLKYVNPAAKETNDGLRNALGADYAVQLRSAAAPHAGSKLARQKHQIGTLFANAKLKELEMIENRAQGAKAKQQTRAKYGW